MFEDVGRDDSGPSSHDYYQILEEMRGHLDYGHTNVDRHVVIAGLCMQAAIQICNGEAEKEKTVGSIVSYANEFKLHAWKS